MFDFLAVSGSTEGRWIEYVDHLHEHFATPVRVEGGHYLPPSAPGTGAEILPSARAEFRFPDGPTWSRRPSGESPVPATRPQPEETS
jgi:L-fuconate dehydratase